MIFHPRLYASGSLDFTISEKKLVYAILFILLPIMDMFNGYGVVKGFLPEGGIASPSQVGRVFMLSVFAYLIVKHKINIWILIIFVPLLMTEFISGILLQDAFGFSYGVISVYKLIYIVLTGVVLTFLVRDSTDMRIFSKFLKINLMLIATSIYFSLITGLGNSTYGWGLGTKGFFASGNGLGIYLGMSCLILMMLRRYKLYDGFGVLATIYIMFSIAFIGTKTSFLLCLVILLFVVISSKFKWFWLSLMLCVLIFSWQFILDVLAPIFDVIYSRAVHADDASQYIASGRSDYVKDAISVFGMQDSNIFRLPFGSGAFLSFQLPTHGLQFDTLETDFFDLLFMYGLYGLTVYFVLTFYIAYLLRSHFAMLFIFLLLMLHSVLAGHVLFNGMSSIMFAMFFFIAQYLTRIERTDSQIIRAKV